MFLVSFLDGLPFTAEAGFTLENYVSLYADRFVLQALTNTLGFGVTTVAVALFFGTTIAWLVERTDLSGKAVVYTVMSVGLLLPSFLLAMGWLFILHPRIGAVNQWIVAAGLGQPPFSVQTVPGMGWVQGLSLAALAFVLTAASFRAMDPALEEVARVHGAGMFQVLGRVFLPLVFPGMLASALFIFTIALASFDVPAILGLSNRIFTFSTFVYSKGRHAETAGVSEYGPTAAMSMLMVAVAILLSYWYGSVIQRANIYQVVTGKGYRPRLYELGRWKWLAWSFIGVYFLLSKVLPLLLLIWAASLPFFQAPSLAALGSLSFQNFNNMPVDLLLRGGSNTAILMATVPTATLIVGFAFSWVVTRSRFRFRTVLDFFAFLPHAVPEIIFGVGAVLFSLFVWPRIAVLNSVPLYGTLGILAVVYVVVRLSFATRLLNSALIQVHRELEEAAAMSGASGLRIARSVLAPLVWPALLNGWLWIALLTYRELTVATVLFTPGNLTLPVVVWGLWSDGKLGVSAAITLVLLACFIPLALVYWAVGRRHAAGAQASNLR